MTVRRISLKKYALPFLLACGGIVPQAICRQSLPLADIDISDTNRPLNDALIKVQETLKAPINFEEATYEPQKDGDVPPHLVVHFVPGEKDPVAAVQTILAATKADPLLGGYTFSQHGIYIEVLPAVSRRTPLSQAIITIPYGERTAAATFDLIAAQMSVASGKSVRVLNQPFLAGTLIPFAADKTAAFAVLERFSDLIGPFSFHLVYEPREKDYYLNLQGITVDIASGSLHANKAAGKVNPQSSLFFTKDKN